MQRDPNHDYVVINKIDLNEALIEYPNTLAEAGFWLIVKATEKARKKRLALLETTGVRSYNGQSQRP